MGTILAYALQSAITMTMLYLAYKWLLASENMHAVNRCVILAIYALGIIAPALFPLVQLPRYGSFGMAINPDMVSDLSALVAVNEPVVPLHTPLWIRILLYVYCAGTVVMTVRLLFTSIKIAHLIRSGRKVSGSRYTTVIINDTRIAPFSWGRYVVMNRHDFESSEQAITIHEARHIACRHWVDLVVAEIYLVFNWFSPAAWLLKDEMRTVHEYQADMAVMRSGIDLRAYQMLLINKAIGSKFPALANSLNHSALKKRIGMMMKSPAKGRQAWRTMVFVPAGILALVTINIPAVAAVCERIGSGSFRFEIESAEVSPETESMEKIPVVTDNVSDGHNEPTTAVADIIANDESTDDVLYVDRSQDYVMEEHASPSVIEMEHSDKPIPTPIDVDVVQTPELPAVEMTGTESKQNVTGSPAIFVDGERFTYDDLTAVDPSSIKEISIKKDIPDYPDGVIYISLKKSE